MSPWARFEALGQDVRYGLRMLRRANHQTNKPAIMA